MKKCWGIAIGAILLTAYLAQLSGAALAATPSGDICTATGGGTSYTLSITLGANSSPQGGFAIGASTRHVKSITGSGGQTGTFSTSGLPADTTGSLMLASAAVPGASTSLGVTMSGPVHKSFVVVPMSSPAGTTFSPISCALEPSKGPVSLNFKVNAHPVYSAAAKMWHLVVAIPGAGMVSAREPEPTVGTASSKSVTAPSLVVSKRVGLKTAGKVTLMLRTTPTGQARLASAGALSLKLTVTFNPTGGKSVSKLLHLTLRK